MKLFLTIRQITNIRNVFANNRSTDVKLSKAQLSKKTKLSGFLGKRLGNMMSNLVKKELLDLAVPLAKNVLPKLAIKVTLSVLDELERKKLDKKL